MNSIIPITDPQEARIKKSLKHAIERKQRILLRMNEKLLHLQMELQEVEYEYNSRIGKLYLKDTQLDLEIIRYRHLLELIESGSSYIDAITAVDTMFHDEAEEVDENADQIHTQEEVFHEQQKAKEDTERMNLLKVLWKKILFKFHPDLTTDAQEKSRREMIMIAVNKAYAAGDYDALVTIDRENAIHEIKQSTIQQLEEALVLLENSIQHAQTRYQTLRESEWYTWKIRLERARKKAEDIFASLERKLLDDIVNKIAIVKKLREKVEHVM